MSIVIVGAGPNLGLAVARRFGREGMSVGLIARDAAKLEELANVLNEEGITADFAAVDIRDSEALGAAIALAGGAARPGRGARVLAAAGERVHEADPRDRRRGPPRAARVQRPRRRRRGDGRWSGR